MLNKIIPKSEFSKNVANVVGGTMLAQLITILLSPIISRLFSPADFGLYSIFLNLALTVSIASTFRYELAVMLPQKDEEAINVVSLSLFISFFFSIIIFLTFQLGGKSLLYLIHSEEVASYIPLLSIYVFFFSVMQTVNYWLSRMKMFRRLSAGKVIQSSVTALGSILIFYIGLKTGGLILAFVFGQVSIGIIYLLFFRKDWLRLKYAVSSKVMKEMFSKYIHFLSFNTPLAFLGVLQDLIVAGLIKYYFGNAAAGFFFMSCRILKLPAGIIGAATYQVFYQRINELFPDGKAVQHQVSKVYKQLLLLSIPIFGVILIGGPFLFALAFGKEWHEAGVYSQILIPTLLLSFVLAPVSAVTVVTRMQHYAIYIGVADIILRTISLLIGGYYQSIYIALMCLSGSTSVLLLFVMYWYYYLPMSKKVKAY